MEPVSDSVGAASRGDRASGKGNLGVRDVGGTGEQAVVVRTSNSRGKRKAEEQVIPASDSSEDEEPPPNKEKDAGDVGRLHAVTETMAQVVYAFDFDPSFRATVATDDEALWKLTPALFDMIERNTVPPATGNQQAGSPYSGMLGDFQIYLFIALKKVHKSAQRADAIAKAKEKRQDNPQPKGIHLQLSSEETPPQVDDLRGQKSLDVHQANNVSRQPLHPEPEVVEEDALEPEVVEEDALAWKIIKRARAKARKNRCHRPTGTPVFDSVCTCCECSHTRVVNAASAVSEGPSSRRASRLVRPP